MEVDNKIFDIIPIRILIKNLNWKNWEMRGWGDAGMGELKP
jgi:hypothetical protein